MFPLCGMCSLTCRQRFTAGCALVSLSLISLSVILQELYRRVRGILNKLTPQKFQSLVEQVKNLQINSEERLNRVIDLVFEKALDEPNFSVPYANMCKQLAMVSGVSRCHASVGASLLLLCVPPSNASLLICISLFK